MAREKPTCATCAYHEPGRVGAKGECRRHAPILWGSVSYWPKVEDDDWCGEHNQIAAMRDGGKGNMIARRNYGGQPDQQETGGAVGAPA